MTPTEARERFVVTEIEGFARKTATSGAPMGLSCHVLDSACGYRMMATFRSEEFAQARPPGPATREQRLEYSRELVRRLARARADELNAGLVPERQLQLSA